MSKIPAIKAPDSLGAEIVVRFAIEKIYAHGRHIAAEIAHARGGEIDVVSTNEETRFILKMPLQVLDKSPQQLKRAS